MRPGVALRRGAWCILGLWALRAAVAATAGAVAAGGASAAMGPYARGDTGFWSALVGLLQESPAALAGAMPLLWLSLAFGVLSSVVTPGAILAHLHDPRRLGAFLERGLRWAPAMLTAALWIGLVRAVLLGVVAGVGALVADGMNGTVRMCLLFTFALTVPMHDHARARIITDPTGGRYGPRPTWDAVLATPRRVVPTILGALAWTGTLLAAVGASATALAFPDSGAAPWAVRGLGLIAVTLTVLRLSLAFWGGQAARGDAAAPRDAHSTDGPAPG